MRLLIVLLISSSVVSCAGIERPDTDICVVNAPGQYMRCYNLKRDYDRHGNRKPDANPTLRPVQTVEDVNKYTCVDPDGLANLQAFIEALREECGRKGR